MGQTQRVGLTTAGFEMCDKKTLHATCHVEHQAQTKSYHQRLQACVGSGSSGHVLGGVVTQDVTHAGGGLAHQAGTQVDGVTKDCVLCSDARPHTGTQQLPCRHSNAALPSYGFHAFYNRQCCLQGTTLLRLPHGCLLVVMQLTACRCGLCKMQQGTQRWLRMLCEDMRQLRRVVANQASHVQRLVKKEREHGA